MANVVNEIVDGGRCNGCGACAAVSDGKLRMAMSSHGYLRPETVEELTKQDEELVVSVCGGNSLTHDMHNDVSYDAHWGPHVSVETAYSTDAEVRYQGSSGGVISAIALYLLESGRVDFILQTTADPTDPVGNITRPSYSRAEIIEAAGSRYAPSSPLAHIEALLAAGRPFAFVGKPCDVASLRKMALNDARIDKLIPYKLAFFCAGVPSRKGALGVLEKLGVRHEELESFSYRGMGWPGLTRAKRRDGTEESMDYNSSWGRILNRHLQFRCKVCVDGTGEFADIVCADAWYGKDGYPDFAERDGRSLLVARTSSGRALLDAMVQGGKIATEKLAIAEIRHMQPFQFDRKRTMLARLAAMRFRGRRGPSYHGFELMRLTFKTSPIVLLKAAAGTWRRVKRNLPLR